MEKQKSKQNKTVKSVPEGMRTVTPYLVVEGANDLLRFIEQGFDGKTTSIMKSQDGKVLHATIQVGDSQIMVSDASERYAAGTARLYLYLDDVDATYKRALDANGTSTREPIDEFYGDRSAGIKDPWGNEWWIATHIEDVDDEELRKRVAKFRQGVSA